MAPWFELTLKASSLGFWRLEPFLTIRTISAFDDNVAQKELTERTQMKNPTPNYSNVLEKASHLQKAFLTTGAVLIGVCLAAHSVSAQTQPRGVAYAAPKAGWKYFFGGDKDKAGEDGSGFTSLDGTWSHDNGSDLWDGSKIGGTLSPSPTFGGGNAPGGVMSITEDGVTFLRMQDPGDPRNYGFPDNFSNRKIYFGHDITADGAPDTLLDDGVTLSFRARIPTPKKTKAPLDQLHLSGGTTAKAYPAGGDGYLVSDGGKANVGLAQLGGGLISFALTVPDDNFDDSVAGGTKASFSGLTMNHLNEPFVTANVNFDSPGEFRGVALDPTDWHEYWLTIKADPTGVGTHVVGIYLDGSSQATTNLVVTAGNGNDFAGVGFLAIGGSRTAESWALDLDFVAFTVGAEAPPQSTEPPKFGSVVRQADKIVLTWTGGGTLQSAAEVTGAWTDVAGLASPATITISDPRRFYRIKK